uniref:NADH-ubiquinone oxidoreductase chain 6 n=1 Tax=Eleginops maclovinus TaxID=56733 RepID=A9L9P5_ELEMC|nr:NADH dehydrogenase subunit 6 [Eleginops maclovinus]
MAYFVYLFMVGLVLGMAVVAVNLSPYFAAFGLVVVAGMGCGVIISFGGSFLSLVLFLIYLGGMLVVFVYSAALAAEPFPESFGTTGAVLYFMGLVGVVGVFAILYIEEGSGLGGCSSDEVMGMSSCVTEYDGMSQMYGPGGFLLVLCAWVLLLTLFVVLEMTRGSSRGPLRSV